MRCETRDVRNYEPTVNARHDFLAAAFTVSDAGGMVAF